MIQYLRQHCFELQWELHNILVIMVWNILTWLTEFCKEAITFESTQFLIYYSVTVVVNFLFQLIFIFPLFWGMVMYANEFKTKEKQKLTEIKN